VYIIVNLTKELKNTNYKKSISLMNSITYQCALFQRRKNTNHKEYRELISKLENVDKIFTRSGVELEFAELYLEQVLEAKRKLKGQNASLTAKELQRHTSYAIQALRCNYLRHELGRSFRETAFLIASSEDFQRFTMSGDFAFAKCPGKSRLQEFSVLMSYAEIKKLNDLLYSEFANSLNIDKYALPKALDTEVILIDSFCMESNIHFPVDWVLLRDAVRTLIKSILCIRRHGLTHKIPEPGTFSSKMNSLCIEMTNSRRKQNAKKKRKWIFRKMKSLVKIVKEHAVRYRNILDTRWEESDLARPEAEQILKRLDNVLDKLPAAIKQANERIISGNLTDSGDKILSLYDKSASVIVRGKDGAEVEFGNELLLVEQKDGFIVYYQLYANKTADTNKLQAYLESLKSGIHTIVADRGFSSKSNSNRLEKRSIYNGICPRSVPELTEKRKDPEFRKLQARRSQTEGRIAAVKRFIRRLSPCSSFEDKQSNISWAVLSHNLNLLTRLMIAAQKSKISSAA
jgi:hypothetical protein